MAVQENLSNKIQSGTRKFGNPSPNLALFSCPL